MLTRTGCEARQARLLRRMEADRLDVFVTANFRTVYYLTGSLTSAELPAIFAIWMDGRSLLITSAQEAALADEIILLEAYSIDRVIDDRMADAAALLSAALSGKPLAQLAGVERSYTPGVIEQTLTEAWSGLRILGAGPLIRELRKRKEADEIDEIRQSLRLITAAYDAARATIAPGKTEIEVFNTMQAAVVCEAGTFVELCGDFAVGERAIRGGGPPTARIIQEGELYILDLFPAPHLYFGDTCRTFAVSQPTDLQLRAWEMTCEAVRIGERAIKPGVRAKDVYREIKDFLDSDPLTEQSLWHHAGHGIGHHGHEAPRVIPGSDDIFETGDVITLEPGIYTKALRGGIRLEDNYVVHEDRLENLFHYPREL